MDEGIADAVEIVESLGGSVAGLSLDTVTLSSYAADLVLAENVDIGLIRLA